MCSVKVEEVWGENKKERNYPRRNLYRLNCRNSSCFRNIDQDSPATRQARAKEQKPKTQSNDTR